MEATKKTNLSNPYPIMTVAYHQWEWRNELRKILTGQLSQQAGKHEKSTACLFKIKNMEELKEQIKSDAQKLREKIIQLSDLEEFDVNYYWLYQNLNNALCDFIGED